MNQKYTDHQSLRTPHETECNIHVSDIQQFCHNLHGIYLKYPKAELSTERPEEVEIKYFRNFINGLKLSIDNLPIIRNNLPEEDFLEQTVLTIFGSDFYEAWIEISDELEEYTKLGLLMKIYKSNTEILKPYFKEKLFSTFDKNLAFQSHGEIKG